MLLGSTCSKCSPSQQRLINASSDSVAKLLLLFYFSSDSAAQLPIARAVESVAVTQWLCALLSFTAATQLLLLNLLLCPICGLFLPPNSDRAAQLTLPRLIQPLRI